MKPRKSSETLAREVWVLTDESHNAAICANRAHPTPHNAVLVKLAKLTETAAWDNYVNERELAKGK